MKIQRVLRIDVCLPSGKEGDTWNYAKLISSIYDMLFVETEDADCSAGVYLVSDTQQEVVISRKAP